MIELKYNELVKVGGGDCNPNYSLTPGVSCSSSSAPSKQLHVVVTGGLSDIYCQGVYQGTVGKGNSYKCLPQQSLKITCHLTGGSNCSGQVDYV